MVYPEYTRGDYLITADPARHDMDALVRLIHLTPWAAIRPRDLIERSVGNSLTFGIFHGGEEVGCARLITDHTTFAYLCDVIIDPAHRGKGLSKWLMEVILKYPGLETIRRWSLLTFDAHGLYRQFGFENHPDPTRYMEIFDSRDSERAE